MLFNHVMYKIFLFSKVKSEVISLEFTAHLQTFTDVNKLLTLDKYKNILFFSSKYALL